MFSLDKKKMVDEKVDELHKLPLCHSQLYNIKLVSRKEGIFFSLSALIILLVFFLFIASVSEIEKTKESFGTKRITLRSIDRFVSDFDEYYAGLILESSAKPALTALSSHSIPLSKEDIVDVMFDGVIGATVLLPPSLTTNNSYARSLETQTFRTISRFDYSLELVTQTGYEEFVFEFNVNFTFVDGDRNWSSLNNAVNVFLNPYSLTHPDFPGMVIDDSWHHNDSQCLIDLLFSDSDGCFGQDYDLTP